ncbi:MAG: hypothetical protein R3326_07490 [Gemmatimonadota bacterium]|nr:hypothetical protein [Gemmatimonadota bacterium]
MTLHATTPVRRHPTLWGIPPRYQVFDRRKSPPQSVGRVFRAEDRDAVVVVVYDDVFREFLKREEPFASRHFDWVLDVAPDAPHDTRGAEIVRPNPMPSPTHRAEDAKLLTLEEAVDGLREPGFYRVVRTSDPV